MNPEFEKQSLELMLGVVRQKRRRKQIITAACIALLLMAGLHPIRIILQQPVELDPPQIAERQAVPEKAKFYTELKTQPSLYEQIQPELTSHVVIHTNPNPNYYILNEREMLAVLPKTVAIRFEADGSVSLINLPYRRRR